MRCAHLTSFILPYHPFPRIGRATNNIAEYVALIDGVAACAHLYGRRAQVKAFTDSELLVRQFSGEYKCEHPPLKVLLARLKKVGVKGAGRGGGGLT